MNELLSKGTGYGFDILAHALLVQFSSFYYHHFAASAELHGNLYVKFTSQFINNIAKIHLHYTVRQQ